MEGIDPTKERRVVTVRRLVEATPERIFDLLTDPRRHADLDGSGTVRGRPEGPERLGPGATFTMAMSQAGAAYRSVSRVVEFEEGRRIAWESMGAWRGRELIGGQRWRYVLTPQGPGTLVEHSYVWGYATLPMLTVWLGGYPRRAAPSMTTTLANLAAAVE
jgi:uncharacterized protein YndB with AHSA1/START domain